MRKCLVFIFIYLLFSSFNLAYSEENNNQFGLYGMYLGMTYPEVVREASSKGIKFDNKSVLSLYYPTNSPDDYKAPGLSFNIREATRLSHNISENKDVIDKLGIGIVYIESQIFPRQEVYKVTAGFYNKDDKYYLCYLAVYFTSEYYDMYLNTIRERYGSGSDTRDRSMFSYVWENNGLYALAPDKDTAKRGIDLRVVFYNSTLINDFYNVAIKAYDDNSKKIKSDM